ncbi:MAG: hypothetical protein NTU53_13910 [Planctomycetota bacterium]|nr:hypothetical protein [Planctomycetota bacterium]
MLRRLFILLSLISLLLALFLLFLPLYSLVTNPHLSVNLPLGLQLSADASHFPAQLTFTLWKPETKQWWLSRPPTSPINLTASKTVEISDG